MRLVIDLGQVLEIQVGVDLRSAYVGMAEQILHRTQVLRRFEHMAGEAVPEHVRVQVLAQLAHTGLAHPQLHRTRAQAAPLLADEHRAIGGIAQRPQRQPGLQGLACLAPDRQHTRLVALALHLHQPGPVC